MAKKNDLSDAEWNLNVFNIFQTAS